MNAVLIAVAVMLLLSLLRVQVIVAIIVGALTGGLIGGLGISETISTFTTGLGNSAPIALSYAMLGGFAISLSKTGLPDAMIQSALKWIGNEQDTKKQVYSKILILFIILTMACFSQNIIPVHIAFIPILIPALLKVLNELKVDRRLVTCLITFGLTTPYMWVPAGFGKIYHDVLQTNAAQSGLTFDVALIPKAMTIPAIGMIIGLCVAVFITYRNPRTYETEHVHAAQNEIVPYTKRSITFGLLSIIATLTVQLATESMIFGALAGIIVLSVSGSLPLKEADAILTSGMRMMSFIGFVMISAAGFGAVLRKTGHVESLVQTSAHIIGNSKPLAAFLMLVIGLLVTMGIGSSFSTIPILTTIFVPLCIQLGFSPMATIAIIGTAGALGDAGSPASDSTLGPTSGLNADGQHHHIWDTCVPTFLHYNIPLLIFGFIAAITL
ncbi:MULTISPECIES: Na+/H+ antiporter family protein [Bacillus]|uniref:Na+/H+ antiporter family protein n=1 Tax=Bacillus TaxID=1386 RepID=UPI000469747D|nr:MULTISPECIES: Na+/H+ antiporter family protein [Bacillus]MED1411357.1 Na+/H+ antiporter family protein [Bacillus paramycoides]MED1461825.1 Na+/H+ antiporter family protein [Bacillus paramycoides]MED1494978.1 Na+/H+ antiporter family protein [Bacillus paramycoides]